MQTEHLFLNSITLMYVRLIMTLYDCLMSLTQGGTRYTRPGCGRGCYGWGCVVRDCVIGPRGKGQRGQGLRGRAAW